MEKHVSCHRNTPSQVKMLQLMGTFHTILKFPRLDTRQSCFLALGMLYVDLIFMALCMYTVLPVFGCKTGSCHQYVRKRRRPQMYRSLDAKIASVFPFFFFFQTEQDYNQHYCQTLCCYQPSKLAVTNSRCNFLITFEGLLFFQYKRNLLNNNFHLARWLKVSFTL